MQRMEINERLRWAREKAGYESAIDAALALKIPYGTYSGHENSGRGIPLKRIPEYAKKFKVSIEWLLTGQGVPRPTTVPVVGLAGAGPEGSVDFSFGQGELGDAPAPPNWTEKTVAVEVRGDSMRGIAENGWLVYYDDWRNPPIETMFGELCVVGVENGRTLIKTLQHGTKKGRFHLESMSAPTIRDALVEWAALVTAIIPRSSKKRAAA